MSKTHYIKVWKAEDGWRWHEMKSSDIVAESGEAYEHVGYAMEQAKEHAPNGLKDIRIEGQAMP